jgi:hypothetical protein
VAPNLDNLFWVSSTWLKIEVFKVMCSPKLLLALQSGARGSTILMVGIVGDTKSE